MVTILPPAKHLWSALFAADPEERRLERRVMSTWWAFRWYEIKHGRPFFKGDTND